ncbi:MAG: hypothetical protein ACK4NZ_10395 [Tsuneonella sp.]
MTTKRTPINRNRGIAITPEAVTAYRKSDWLGLHRALGLKPWQHNPLDVGDFERPAWFNEDDWNLQQSLRAEIEAAIA